MLIHIIIRIICFYLDITSIALFIKGESDVLQIALLTTQQSWLVFVVKLEWVLSTQIQAISISIDSLSLVFNYEWNRGGHCLSNLMDQFLCIQFNWEGFQGRAWIGKLNVDKSLLTQDILFIQEVSNWLLNDEGAFAEIVWLINTWYL